MLEHKLISEKNMNEENIATDPMDEFKTVEDYLNYFLSMDYKLVKDIKSEKSRTLALRRYVMGEYAEAVIKQTDSVINVIQTLDGKPVFKN